MELPADVTHATITVVGRGGDGHDSGGGGAGGELFVSTVWRQTSSLTVEMNSGGSGDSGATVVKQSGTPIITAKNGRSATGATGANNTGHHTSLQYGSSGGNGTGGCGGGGGAAGTGNSFGSVGENAPGSGVAGVGGVASSLYIGLGDGGDGGTPGNDGEDGENYGGGGGGAGSGAGTPGTGKGGVVIFQTGAFAGYTLASSGCCCSPCDLSKGEFPNTVNFTFAFADPPDTWDDDAVDIDDYVRFFPGPAFICGEVYGDRTFTGTGPSNVPRSILQQDLVSMLNGFHPVLKMTSFETDNGEDEETSSITNRCVATYECDLTPDDLPAGLGGFPDRTCYVGEHPGGDYESPHDNLCEGAYLESDPCDPSSVSYVWVRRGQVRAECGASVVLERRLSDGKYRCTWSLYAKLYWMQKGGSYYADGCGTTIGDHPDSVDFSVYPNMGDSRPLIHQSGSGDDSIYSDYASGWHTTASAALSEAKSATGDTLTVIGEYDNYSHQGFTMGAGFNGGVCCFGWWYTTSQSCCDEEPLPNGIVMTTMSSESYTYEPAPIYYSNMDGNAHVSW